MPDLRRCEVERVLWEATSEKEPGRSKGKGTGASRAAGTK